MVSEYNSYGVYDLQLDQFKERWTYFDKTELKIEFELYMKDVLIEGSEIEKGDWMDDEELWGLFGYEIRPM